MLSVCLRSPCRRIDDRDLARGLETPRIEQPRKHDRGHEQEHRQDEQADDEGFRGDGRDELAAGDEQDVFHAATSFTNTSSSVGRAISIRAGGTAIARRGITDGALAPSCRTTLQPWS